MSLLWKTEFVKSWTAVFRSCVCRSDCLLATQNKNSSNESTGYAYNLKKNFFFKSHWLTSVENQAKKKKEKPIKWGKRVLALQFKV